MCIYCGTKKYRKIYENHHGPIPRDEYGRKYDIHHIDGNHSNNDPMNLKAVTINEHYDIHYSQGDYGACILISRKMNFTSEELAHLAGLSAKKRVQEGTHPFLGGAVQREVAQKLLKAGTHPFLGGTIQRNLAYRLVAEGTHPSQKVWECPYSGKVGKGKGNYTRHHGDSCKMAQI